MLLGLLSISVPATALLIYQNLASIDVVKKQVTDSYRVLVSQHMERIDEGLGDVDRYLRYQLVLGSEVAAMDSTRDPDQYQLARIRLANTLGRDLFLYRSIDGLFCFSVVRDDWLQVFKTGGSYAERRLIHDRVKHAASGIAPDSNTDGDKWLVEQIGQGWYIMRILRIGDTCIGAWSRADNLIGSLAGLDLGKNGHSIFLTSAGDAMNSADTKIELIGPERATTFFDKDIFLAPEAASGKGPFRLIFLIPESQVLRRLPSLLGLIGMISMLSLVLLPLGLLFLRNGIFRPLDGMLVAMSGLHEGRLESRAMDNAPVQEIQDVIETFNCLMTEIDTLKISVYEEQLDRQREELLRLQAQVNPHFYLNTLNIMFSLIQTGKYELARELVLCLVAYFRFMVRGTESLVPLEAEIGHVRNYHRIQELRFPGRHSLEIEVPDFLGECRVPPLILQIFVENTIKYGSASGNVVRIRIRAEHAEANGKEYLDLEIADSGPGFPKQLEAPLPRQGTHLGIQNVRRRLALLFGEEGTLDLSNGGELGGALVRIRMPFNVGAS